MKTKTKTITKTIRIYEPGDVVYDVCLRQFFLIANRTPEIEVPGKETFSAFRLAGRGFAEPRVISQDPEEGNENDTVRYVGTLWDYWKSLETGRVRIRR
jgi:hypothetical protein